MAWRLDDVDVSDFFSLDHSIRTRGHNFKIKKQNSRLDIRISSVTGWLVNGMTCHIAWLIALASLLLKVG